MPRRSPALSPGISRDQQMASATETRGTGLTGLAAATLGLALLALVTPLSGTEAPIVRVGWLLAVAAGIEGLHALGRATPGRPAPRHRGAVISMVIALFLINAPFVAAERCASWSADGSRSTRCAARSR